VSKRERKSSNNERIYTSKSSATGRKDMGASLVQPFSDFRFDEDQWCEPFRTPIVDVFRTDHRRNHLMPELLPICAALIGMWLKAGAEMWIHRDKSISPAVVNTLIQCLVILR
jgi:hypothetical protein